MFAFDEARCLEQAFQNDFAPVTLHFRVALQGTGQVVGLFAQAVVQFHKVLDAFAQ